MSSAITKTALITGSAKRLGRAIAEDLAEHGFAVAIHANHSIDEAKEVARAITDKGGRAIAVQADLCDIAQTSSLLEKVNGSLGTVGLLVNNASVFLEDDADRFDAGRFAQHFDLHLRAPAILADRFNHQLPEMQQGLIVNIIDQRVWALKPTFFSYTLSKSALWTATRTLAQALSPRIRVNAIGPGPSLPSDRQRLEDFQAQIETLPLKRGPAIEEFGRTVRFLFDTPSVTGQMIALDGGQHLIWPGANGAEIAE
ncbi:SDR family oxidoreductase [Allorhizobium undicola]|uniref:SDR family oxidoreductase n=1 Tax=Allorhizobium undicola TaxID=78527 RepID=UPI00047FCEEA|nr:SDR family oxidoreductase [Allorhizobium undicola]